MAITELGLLAYGGSRTANQASLTIITQADVAAGELIVVFTSVDVAGTSSGIDMSSYGARMGGPSGTLFDGTHGNQPGTGSQTGVACTLWWLKADQAYPTGTQIWVGFRSPTEADHSALTAFHFKVGVGNTFAVDNWATNVQTTAIDYPAMDVTTANVQCLRVRGVGATWVSPQSPSFVSTSGWSSWQMGLSGPVLTPDWEVMAVGESLIYTGTNQVSDPRVVVNQLIHTNIYVAFQEVPLPPITGTLAATEGGDSAGFSGISNSNLGWLEAYEGAVWLRADSTLYTADDNVTRVNTAGQIRDTANFVGQVLTGPIGVIAATEGADTAAFAGLVGRSGVLSAIEAADVASFAGTAAMLAALAATENADTAAFAGTVRMNAALAATEGSDTASFNGVALFAVTGTLAATEASDTAAFTGALSAYGTLAATEGADTSVFSGVITNSGALHAVEGADTAAFPGSVAWTGVLAVTEAGADVAAFTGRGDPVGTFAATEGSDVPAFTGYLSLVNEKIGTLNAFEDRLGGYSEPRADSTLVTADNTLFHVSIDYYGIDRALFSGEISTNAQIDATEGADVAAFAGEVLVTGVLAAAEDSNDTAAFDGSVGYAITGRMAAQEGRDTALFIEAALAVTGVLAAQEAPDIAYFAMPIWEVIGEDNRLRNEIQRTLWLAGRGGRVRWLENEVEDTSEMENLNPEVVFLENEVLRISELRP